MMIVTAHLHQTDTKRVQPCCVAAVPRNNASGGKDLVFHPQRALWLRAPSSAQQRPRQNPYDSRGKSTRCRHQERVLELNVPVLMQEQRRNGSNGNLPVSREGGWRGRRRRNLLTRFRPMKFGRYFSSKWYSQTRKDPLVRMWVVNSCAIAILGSAGKK